jgi:hypothetical protein
MMGECHKNYALKFLPCLGWVYSGFDSHGMEVLFFVSTNAIFKVKTLSLQKKTVSNT